MAYKLTNLKVAALPLKSSHYMESDGNGLYIKVYPNGRKQWVLRKSSQGKATNTVLGEYPAISLASARSKAKELSSTFVDGRKQKEDKTVLFKDVVEQWLATKDVRPSTMVMIRTHIKHLAIFNERPLNTITALEAREAVGHYIDAGQIMAARHTLSALAQIERHGLALGLTDAARLQHVGRTLPKAVKGHHRSIEADRLPEVFKLLRDCIKYDCDAADMFKVLCLTLCRQNEVRALRYDWIDFDAKVITIPASQMKAKREHRIPICPQLERILKKRLELGGVFVFPSTSSKSGHRTKKLPKGCSPVLELTSVHGIRSMGRSWMALHGYEFAACEYCLAHQVENATQAAYQRYDYLEQRRIIMNDWGNYVEQCYSPYFPD